MVVGKPANWCCLGRRWAYGSGRASSPGDTWGGASRGSGTWPLSMTDGQQAAAMAVWDCAKRARLAVATGCKAAQNEPRMKPLRAGGRLALLCPPQWPQGPGRR